MSRTLLETSLTLRRTLGEKWGVAVSLGSLAWVALLQGDLERSRRLLLESLISRQEIGDKGGCAWRLEQLAEIAQRMRDWSRAARLYGAAAAVRLSAVDPSEATSVSGPPYRGLQRPERRHLCGSLERGPDHDP